MGRKVRGFCPPFGRAGSLSNTMWPGPYLHTKWYPDPLSHLATIYIGRNVGVVGPHLTQCCLTKAYCRTMWHLDPSNCLATIDMGRKVRGFCPPFGRAGSLSNTMWPGHSPTSTPSGILIPPTAWPQQTWAADYTDAGKACIPKLRKGGCCAPFHGELFLHLTRCGLGRGQPPHQVAS